MTIIVHYRQLLDPLRIIPNRVERKDALEFNTEAQAAVGYERR